MKSLDMVASAAVDYLEKPENKVYSIDAFIENRKLYDSDFSLPGVTAGWAKRPKHGKRYGTNYFQGFEIDLPIAFDAGTANSVKKMNNSMMLECLGKLYPNRFDSPSEEGIKKFV